MYVDILINHKVIKIAIQFAIDKLPMLKSGAVVNFGMDVSTMTRTNLDTWMKFTRKVVVTPPPDQTCPTGQHWDTTQNKCVDDVIVTPPPPITGDTKKQIADHLRAIADLVEKL